MKIIAEIPNTIDHAKETSLYKFSILPAMMTNNP